MSVLVRGMKMPKDCPYCPMSHWNALNFFVGCEVTKKHFSQEELDSSERPDFCPLIEIPEDKLFPSVIPHPIMWYTIESLKKAPQNSQNCGEKSEGES